MAERKRQRGETRISYKTKDRVVIRGLDLCNDLIGKVGFSEYFLFMVTGVRPTPTLVRLVDASMVSIAEHGLGGSVQAARMTFRAAPEALQGAVAAGLLSCGSVVLGTSENAGRLLSEIVKAVETQKKPLEQVVVEKMTRIRDAKGALPGFGHSIHRDGDPRSTRLIEFAGELGVRGAHCAALEEMGRHVEEIFGKKLPPNISSAIPAVLLDGGFPVDVLRGIPILARAAALIAHLAEEKQHSIANVLTDAADDAVDYVGVAAN